MLADYALVGGGLQNGLVALAIRAATPDARIALIERGDTLGGNHTWCFHAGDLPAGTAAWLDPLVCHRWDGYDVAFPAHRRHLESAYACVTSDRFAEVVGSALARPGSVLLTRATALEVGPHRVTVRTDDGEQVISATTVIDARGPEDGSAGGTCGWQKFLGQELVLTAPHGLTHPMLMDATVPQTDGFRFFYLLPFARDRVLVEDTYFSDGTHLDATRLRGEIGDYVAARGWQIREVVREETGLLPLPWHVSAPVIAAPLRAGYAGRWFHPVTGYSFPIAARLAAAIANGDDLEELARAHGRQLRFASRLNKMLFHWFPPDQRYHVLERFYRLPEALVRRFYALDLTTLDRTRILVGRPPRGMSWRAALGGTPSW